MIRPTDHDTTTIKVIAILVTIPRGEGTTPWWGGKEGGWCCMGKNWGVRRQREALGKSLYCGLHSKGPFTGKLFTICRNWLALGKESASPPTPHPHVKASEFRKQKT